MNRLITFITFFVDYRIEEIAVCSFSACHFVCPVLSQANKGQDVPAELLYKAQLWGGRIFNNDGLLEEHSSSLPWIRLGFECKRQAECVQILGRLRQVIYQSELLEQPDY